MALTQAASRKRNLRREKLRHWRSRRWNKSNKTYASVLVTPDNSAQTLTQAEQLVYATILRLHGNAPNERVDITTVSKSCDRSASTVRAAMCALAGFGLLMKTCRQPADNNSATRPAKSHSLAFYLLPR